MPAAIIPTEGVTQQHQWLLGVDTGIHLPWKLMLWVNDYTPTTATVLADLVEASWSGYSRVLLDPAMYTFADPMNGCSHAQWGTDPYVWYVTGGPVETIFGWAAIDELAGVIRRVQRFDADDIGPVTVGGQVLFLPVFTLTSAECQEYTDATAGGSESGGRVGDVFVP
jgi:hypothetical protein